MSFGRNPYAPKAESAEQKAEAAGDVASRERAYREAAHEWERAASREKPGKRRDEYLGNAERNRAMADSAQDDGLDAIESAQAQSAETETETGAGTLAPTPVDPTQLN